MHADEIPIDETLVRRLLRDQCAELADQRLERVEPWGTDNAIWRLGDDLVVRLPRIGWAEGQIHREARWLPRLAPGLRIGVPLPVFVGRPGDDYPYAWAVHRWLPGIAASIDTIEDPVAFAVRLAGLLRELQTMPTAGAPPARGRARPLQDYDREARAAIADAAGLVDTSAATAVWEEARRAHPHHGAEVWVHGDLEGNCLVADGRLTGLVDWGSACAGDPAVDVQVIWSPLFTADSRAAFIEALAIDGAAVARSRGAAIYQACAALSYYRTSYPLIVERSRHKLTALGVPLLR
jgi:aminoglycoside phosphotransferase (APT) family kinase protein